MAPHSSTLAWKIPWTEEPGRLQSMGSLRVGHDWVTSLWLFTFMHWRRTWQPTPVFLPRESQGRGSLVGCCLWGRTELDTLKWLSSSSSRHLNNSKSSIKHRMSFYLFRSLIFFQWCFVGFSIQVLYFFCSISSFLSFLMLLWTELFS